MTKIFYSSTLYGTMSLAAAIDAGLFGAHDERWVLLVSNNTNAPEIVDSFFPDSPAFATLSHRFDDVVRWNDVIAPLHPSGWFPPANEAPLLTRLVIEHLKITDRITRAHCRVHRGTPGSNPRGADPRLPDHGLLRWPDELWPDARRGSGRNRGTRLSAALPRPRPRGRPDASSRVRRAPSGHPRLGIPEGDRGTAGAGRGRCIRCAGDRGAVPLAARHPQRRRGEPASRRNVRAWWPAVIARSSSPRTRPQAGSTCGHSRASPVNLGLS